MARSLRITFRVQHFYKALRNEELSNKRKGETRRCPKIFVCVLLYAALAQAKYLKNSSTINLQHFIKFRVVYYLWKVTVTYTSSVSNKNNLVLYCFSKY